MLAEKEVSDKRMEICESCEHINVVFLIKTCKLCGCLMNVKTTMPNATCPIGKW